MTGVGRMEPGEPTVSRAFKVAGSILAGKGEEEEGVEGMLFS